MKTFLTTAAVLGLALSNAGACEYMRSAKAEKIDKTVVASIAVPASEPAQSTVAAPDAAAEKPAEK